MKLKNQISLLIVYMTIAASCCQCAQFNPTHLNIIYAKNKDSNETTQKNLLDHLNYDLYFQQLPDGKSVRLTDWHRDALLDKGMGLPQWSPNGNYVLFNGHLKDRKPIFSANNWPLYLWVINMKTKKLKLINKTINRWYLDTAWLTGDQDIIALVIQSKKPQFYYNIGLQRTYEMSGAKTNFIAINIATGKERVIKNNIKPGRFFVSPKYQQIIYYYRDSGKLTFFNLKTAKWRTINSRVKLDQAAISPDGKFFAYHNNGVIKLINIQSGVSKLLCKIPNKSITGHKIIWSPDGKSIALSYSSGHIYSVDPPLADTSSFIISIDTQTGKSSKLFEDGRSILLGWTPDSDCISIKREQIEDQLSKQQVITISKINGAIKAVYDLPKDINTNLIDYRFE